MKDQFPFQGILKGEYRQGTVMTQRGLVTITEEDELTRHY